MSGADAERWLAGVLAERGIAPRGEPECLKDRPWGRVLRVPTGTGDLFCKACGSGGRYEPALVAALAERFPDRVRAPLAIDAERGFLLMEDGGVPLREALTGEARLALLVASVGAWAEIQRVSAAEPERWRALGVPDRAPSRLPELYAALLEEEELPLEAGERRSLARLLPELEARCDELAACPCPVALDHGDLHDGNVLVQGGVPWLFDLGDANLAHPLATLFIAWNASVEDFESEASRRLLARLLEAWSQPFAGLLSRAEIGELLPAAFWCAHVGRALDYHQHLAGVADDQGFRPRMAIWLRDLVAHRPWLRADHWLSGFGAR